MNNRLSFLALSLFLSTGLLLTGCGSGDDVAINPDSEIVGLEVRPEELELEMDSTFQLFAASVFNNGGRRIVNAPLSWSTSNPAVATVDSAGVTTAVAPGQVTILVNGAGLTASSRVHVLSPEVNRILVSSRDTDSVQVLDLDGNVLRSLDNVADPAQVVLVGNELYVGAGNEVRVYSWTASANDAPIRTITGFGQVTGLAVIGEELFVADFDQNAIRVFPVTSAGNAAPSREITEGLSGPGLLTVSEEQLVVVNNVANSVVVFDVEGEQQAVLEGPNTGLTTPVGVAVHEGELFVSGNNEIRVFSLEEDGDVAPVRVLQSASLNNPAGLAVVNERLVVANEGGGNVLLFALDAADQDAPVATLQTVPGAAGVTASFTP
jgi:sugar lactone lactonase YvrE